MNDAEPIDPSEHGYESRAALILAVVDGQLARAEIERLQVAVDSEPTLRSEIERARCLRALVSTLPRVAVPAHVAAYTERLTQLAGQRRTASGRPSIEALLGALPARSAPAGIADAVLLRVRAARASRALADRRISRRRVVAGLAAALLATVTTNLFIAPPSKSKSGRRFSFEVVEVGLIGGTAKTFAQAELAALGPSGGVR